MSNKEITELQGEIRELGRQVQELTELLQSHIESENDLIMSWKAFNWSKKTGIQFITVVGSLVGITWGILQIYRIIR